MNKLGSVALAALVAFSGVAASMSTPAEARKGRNTALAVGAVLGIAAAAALANSANSQPRRSSSWANQCRKLYNRCVNGSNYSCEKYETGGCTE